MTDSAKIELEGPRLPRGSVQTILVVLGAMEAVSEPFPETELGLLSLDDIQLTLNPTTSATKA